MSVVIIFETHSISEDNEAGFATGWLPGRLSTRGRALAQEMGQRHRNGQIDAVLTSDLRRAVETTELAFEGTGVPILHDWRLRECNYGGLNGMPVSEHFAIRSSHLAEPYPGGESWREAVGRVHGCLQDIRDKWDGGHVVVIGHTATRWALDHFVRGEPLETLISSEFMWQEGWEYVL